MLLLASSIANKANNSSLVVLAQMWWLACTLVGHVGAAAQGALPDVQEESLSLQGLHAPRQIWRRAVRAGVCLCQQGRQLVNVEPPVVRQVIL